jgi:GxxExxY protein
MEQNEITYQIRGAIYTVYNELGPGLLESVYESALAHELSTMGLRVKTQVGLPVHYKDVSFEIGFRIDLLVEDEVIVEIKSIESLQNIHKKQLLTYLKLSGYSLGLLVNFNVDKFIDRVNIIRIIN